jgi:hypothetical protein
MTGVKGVVGLVIAAVAVLVAAAGVFVVTSRMAMDNLAAERRALLARQAALNARVLAPGSPLACLDGGAGETVGNACEKMVFADAATTSAALSFTAARLVLLQDVAKLPERDKGDIAAAFATARRSVQLDRFGLAAQVLSDRDGCTPEHCAAFSLVSEAGALKANMKARVFEQYVSRYAAGWGGHPASPAPEPAPQASAPAAPASPNVASVEPPPASGHPVDPKWDFPSAASIPAVSIMNAEPPRPKLKDGTEARAAQPGSDGVPVPPKRPQAPAPTATQAR